MLFICNTRFQPVQHPHFEESKQQLPLLFPKPFLSALRLLLSKISKLTLSQAFGYDICTLTIRDVVVSLNIVMLT